MRSDATFDRDSLSRKSATSIPSLIICSKAESAIEASTESAMVLLQVLHDWATWLRLLPVRLDRVGHLTESRFNRVGSLLVVAKPKILLRNVLVFCAARRFCTIGQFRHGSLPRLQNLAAPLCSQVLHDWSAGTRLTEAREMKSCRWCTRDAADRRSMRQARYETQA